MQESKKKTFLNPKHTRARARARTHTLKRTRTHALFKQVNSANRSTNISINHIAADKAKVNLDVRKWDHRKQTAQFHDGWLGLIRDSQQLYTFVSDNANQSRNAILLVFHFLRKRGRRMKRIIVTIMLREGDWVGG